MDSPSCHLFIILLQRTHRCFHSLRTPTSHHHNTPLHLIPRLHTLTSIPRHKILDKTSLKFIRCKTHFLFSQILSISIRFGSLLSSIFFLTRWVFAQGLQYPCCSSFYLLHNVVVRRQRSMLYTQSRGLEILVPSWGSSLEQCQFLLPVLRRSTTLWV